MLDSLVHLLGQVPGRAFPDERRVPQLARQHGRCCSCRLVQVLALIELFRAKTREKLQMLMSRNLKALAMILKRSGTLWDTRRGQHVLRRAVGKIDHETNPTQLSCYHLVSDVMPVFLSGTPSLTSTSAC